MCAPSRSGNGSENIYSFFAYIYHVFSVFSVMNPEYFGVKSDAKEFNGVHDRNNFIIEGNFKIMPSNKTIVFYMSFIAKYKDFRFLTGNFQIQFL